MVILLYVLLDGDITLRITRWWYSGSADLVHVLGYIKFFTSLKKTSIYNQWTFCVLYTNVNVWYHVCRVLEMQKHQQMVTDTIQARLQEQQLRTQSLGSASNNQ